MAAAFQPPKLPEGSLRYSWNPCLSSLHAWAPRDNETRHTDESMNDSSHAGLDLLQIASDSRAVLALQLAGLKCTGHDPFAQLSVDDTVLTSPRVHLHLNISFNGMVPAKVRNSQYTPQLNSSWITGCHQTDPIHRRDARTTNTGTGPELNLALDRLFVSSYA